MKKFLTFILVLALVLSVSSVAMAVYSSACSKTDHTSCTHVASITNSGTTYYYDSLQTAIDEAVDCDTITLMKSVGSSSVITITDKTITLDLNGKDVTGTGDRLFRISSNDTTVDNVAIINGNIVNDVSGGRCVETRSGNVTLNLTGVTLTAKKGASQPLTVGGSGSNIEVNITDSTLDAGTGYGITTFNPVKMTITNSTVTGYAALNIKVADGSLGSAGSTFNVVGSTLTGVNAAAEDPTNSFSTIMIEDSNVTVNVDGNSEVVAKTNSGNGQVIFGYGNELVNQDISGSDVNVAVGAKLTRIGTNTGILGVNSQQPDGIGGNTVTVPAEYVSDIADDGFSLGEVKNGLVEVENRESGPSVHIAPNTLDFESAVYGYSAIEPKKLVVTNDGSVPINVSVSNSSYTFTPEDSELTNIQVGGSVTFWVAPKTGLGVGIHDVKIEITVEEYEPTTSANPMPPTPEDSAAPTRSSGSAAAFATTASSRKMASATGTNGVQLLFTVTAPSGNGISVKYNGGNSFSTSNPSVPTGVEIDGVPVTFNGTGSNFSVGCISSDAKWVTVRWNSTSVTTNFTPDGLVECTTVSIPKTGDMSFWAAIAQFLGF